jgi:SAM-dependent methyltransferase
MFATSIPSSRTSKQTLDQLYEHDDFMESIQTLVDLGCGQGQDLEWWATATTRDEENQEPLNIKCVGIDTLATLSLTKKYKNIMYQQADFEEEFVSPLGDAFDILWCWNSFQFAINPLRTLGVWRNLASTGAMLVIAVPDTTFIHHKQLSFAQPSGCYYHHTMVGLIHMLAVNGWDCHNGFFMKMPKDPWIQAIVYKSEHEPMDPRTTTWHELEEKKLLPESARPSLQRYNHLRQQDLVVPWIDRSFVHMGQQ